jgi:DNA-binding NtrC family response regulator
MTWYLTCNRHGAPGKTGTMTCASPASHPNVAPMNLLVLDDELYMRRLCSVVASRSGMCATAVATAQQALKLLESSTVDILILDLELRDSDGMDLLRHVHDSHSEVGVIVVTGRGTIESAAMATRLGAMHYVTKPFSADELRFRLEDVARVIKLQHETRLLRQRLRTEPGFGPLIGLSPQMQSIYKIAEKISQHQYPVLILGETGTGKELLARSVHSSGPRWHRQFYPVDCSSLTPTLIETELFGHVRGAFTGAIEAKRGLLEAADGGTLFLDEIGDMPVDLQAKLLRVLQEHQFRPVGSTETKRIDVRIISATNCDLDAAIRAGTFRQDLYFRLNVVQLKIPPLRDRKTDIPLLVAFFIEKFSAIHGSPGSISEHAMKQLMAYDWPGNVRELENVVERSLALSSGVIMELSDLPSNFHLSEGTGITSGRGLLALKEIERRAILDTLQQTKGNKVKAARQLRIGKTTLYRKLRTYDGPSIPKSN